MILKDLTSPKNDVKTKVKIKSFIINNLSSLQRKKQLYVCFCMLYKSIRNKGINLLWKY